MKHHIKLRNEELNRLTIEEFKQRDKIPVTVVLDNVRSLNNVGSVFRTCDALNVSRVFLCGITATPPHPDIYKTALGAENAIEWKYFESTSEAVEQLKNESFYVIAIEQTQNCIDLREFVPEKDMNYAFIFGNELKGVDQEVIDLCHEVIEIPQFGTKHSFNIAVTTGIVLWDFFTKHEANKKEG